MRTSVLTGARSMLLVGPVVLAFFSGGFFDGPRVWAGVLAWVLVLVSALVAPRPLPRSAPALLALALMLLFAAWTLASLTWAAIPGAAYHDGQRVFLYAGVLIAAAALLRAVPRAVEPALGAGIAVVMLYALSERLLPGLISLQHSASAAGRLEQPLTYWNAMGELAAVGFVLLTRVAGDTTRGPRMGMLASASAPVLGLALYLSFSRGALFACGAGLLTLVVASRSKAQLRAIVLALVLGAVASLVGAALSSVTSVSGALHVRERDGAVMLAALVALGAIGALLQRRPRSDAPLRLPRGAPVAALVLVLAGFALFIVVGAKETAGRPLASDATRLTSLQSSRYAYWRVALRAFRNDPVHGVGGGGWAVYWLRYRTFPESAQDAHSLYIQTLAEFGLIGVAILAAFLASVAWCVRRAHALSPALASGLLAGAVVFATHASVDWDWEMPAATLPALLLVGALIALSDQATDAAAGLGHALSDDAATHQPRTQS